MNQSIIPANDTSHSVQTTVYTMIKAAHCAVCDHRSFSCKVRNLHPHFGKCIDQAAADSILESLAEQIGE